MKLILGLFAILLIVIGGVYYTQKGFDFSLLFPKTATITIKDHLSKPLIAKTDKEKEIGLSEKTSINKDSGMLFVFDKADFYSFWMKNMKFPIDIIFINKDRIVTIHSNLKPPVVDTKDEDILIYKPEEPADRVLEIQAGLSDSYGFKKGDEVKIEGL